MPGRHHHHHHDNAGEHNDDDEYGDNDEIPTRSSGLGVNFSICSTMSTGNWSLASMLMIALQHHDHDRDYDDKEICD